MKSVYQTKYGGISAASDEQGNCFAACLASILEINLNDVPDLGGQLSDDNNAWWFTIRDWLLEKHDLYLLPIRPDSIELNDLEGYQLLAVESETLPKGEGGHLVVGYNGSVIFDPNKNTKKVYHKEYNVEEIWIFVSNMKKFLVRS